MHFFSFFERSSLIAFIFINNSLNFGIIDSEKATIPAINVKKTTYILESLWFISRTTKETIQTKNIAIIAITPMSKCFMNRDIYLSLADFGLMCKWL